MRALATGTVSSKTVPVIVKSMTPGIDPTPGKDIDPFTVSYTHLTLPTSDLV